MPVNPNRPYTRVGRPTAGPAPFPTEGAGLTTPRVGAYFADNLEPRAVSAFYAYADVVLDPLTGADTNKRPVVTVAFQSGAALDYGTEAAAVAAWIAPYYPGVASVAALAAGHPRDGLTVHDALWQHVAWTIG